MANFQNQRNKAQQLIDMFRRKREMDSYRAAQDRQNKNNTAKNIYSLGNKYAPTVKNMYNNYQSNKAEGINNTINGSPVANNIATSVTNNTATPTLNNFGNNISLPSSTIGSNMQTQFAGNGLNTASTISQGANTVTPTLQSTGTTVGNTAGSMSQGASTGLSAAGKVAGGIGGAASVGMDIANKDYLSAGLDGVSTAAMMAGGPIGWGIAAATQIAKMIKGAKDKKNQEALQRSAKEGQKNITLQEQNAQNAENINNQQTAENNQELIDNTQQAPQQQLPDGTTISPSDLQQNTGAKDGYLGTLPELDKNTYTGIETPQYDTPQPTPDTITTDTNVPVDSTTPVGNGGMTPDEKTQLLLGQVTGGAAPVQDNTQSIAVTNNDYAPIDYSEANPIEPQVVEATPDNTGAVQNVGIDKSNTRNKIVDMLQRVASGYNDNRNNGFNPNNWNNDNYSYTTTERQETNPNVALKQQLGSEFDKAGIQDQNLFDKALQGRNSGNAKVDELIKRVGIPFAKEGNPNNYDSNVQTVEVAKKGKKNLFNKVGEGVGTLNRILSNPVIQGLIAGGIYQARNDDFGKAVEYGANWANNKSKSDMYGKMVNGEDWTPGMFTGMYDTKDYAAKTKEDYYDMLWNKALMQNKVQQQNADTNKFKAENEANYKKGKLQNETKNVNSLVNYRNVSGKANMIRANASAKNAQTNVAKLKFNQSKFAREMGLKENDSAVKNMANLASKGLLYKVTTQDGRTGYMDANSAEKWKAKGAKIEKFAM